MLLELSQVGQNLHQSHVTKGLFISTTEVHQKCHCMLTPNDLSTIWTQLKKVRGEWMRLLVSCRSGHASRALDTQEENFGSPQQCFAPYPD